MGRVKTRSIAKKISVIIVGMILVSCVAVGSIGYILFRGNAIDSGASQALAIAETIAANIDAAEFETMMETGEKTAYYDAVKQNLDETLLNTDISFLYILDNDYDSEVTYFAEGYDPDSPFAPLDFGSTETAEVYADEMFETIRTGRTTTTDIYDSGEFGMMVSGFAPVVDERGNAVGVVGVDLSMEDVLAAANMFGLETILIVVVFSVVFALLSVYVLNRMIGKPISMLTAAAEKLAEGDMNVKLAISSRDEIGRLADSFLNMTASTKRQAEVLESLAEGDLTMDVEARGANDVMSFAIARMVEGLNSMFGEIRQGTAQVASASDQIANAAQLLAQGSTEQATAVDRLAYAIGGVADKTQENAQQAAQAAQLAQTIRNNAEKGASQMQSMVQAVSDIDRANQAIGNVIKVIDDIAFQTNILALNAAVEAARAGQHGKGFAVVADEVRSLAAKSAASAKDTAALIDNSMEKAALGVRLAGETAASLDEIVTGIGESERIVAGISQASQEQNAAITEINSEIEQVAHVVQQNSATAEESAATSEEMSSQSSMLNGLLERFRLRDGGQALPPRRG